MRLLYRPCQHVNGEGMKLAMVQKVVVVVESMTTSLKTRYRNLWEKEWQCVGVL